MTLFSLHLFKHIKIYELFWDHIFIMFYFYFIYYPLFMKSKHMVAILLDIIFVIHLNIF